MKWLSDDRTSPLIDLGKIDRVPVSFVVAINDGLCPPELHEAWFHEIQSPNSYIRYERGGHMIFYFKADDPFLRRMVQTIETGTADPEDNTAQSTMLEIIFTSLFASLLF